MSKKYWLLIILSAIIMPQCTAKRFLYQNKPVPPIALSLFHPDLQKGIHLNTIDLESLNPSQRSYDTLSFYNDTDLWFKQYQWFRHYSPNESISVDYTVIGYYPRLKAFILLSRKNTGGTLTTANMFLVKLRKSRLDMIALRETLNIRDNSIYFTDNKIIADQKIYSIEDYFKLKPAQ